MRIFLFIKKNTHFSCIYQKKAVILQRKMNPALVAKKVLQYLAHAEGICLSGGGKIQDILTKGVLRALFWLLRIW